MFPKRTLNTFLSQAPEHPKEGPIERTPLKPKTTSPKSQKVLCILIRTMTSLRPNFRTNSSTKLLNNKYFKKKSSFLCSKRMLKNSKKTSPTRMWWTFKIP